MSMFKIILISLLTLISTAVSTNSYAKEKSTFELINENPSNFSGKTVTIKGEMEKVYDHKTIRLDGPGWFSKDVIVISDTPIENKGEGILKEGEEITVTGTYYSVPFSDLKIKYQWSINSMIENDIRTNQSYLVIDDISVKNSDNE